MDGTKRESRSAGLASLSKQKSGEPPVAFLLPSRHTQSERAREGTRRKTPPRARLNPAKPRTPACGSFVRLHRVLPPFFQRARTLACGFPSGREKKSLSRRLFEPSKQQKEAPKPSKQQFGAFESLWTAAASSGAAWTATLELESELGATLELGANLGANLGQQLGQKLERLDKPGVVKSLKLRQNPKAP
ncbi:hypothetical protein KFK09_006471 [Dendrobium nobile]|uniref:Uncharacterized protein n=1 Tax=Dendrobium nobile TaxID=94219 RepID=A0A8T3BPC2_DENNO|nr:hypothetical protein KFK09_006471 [Dendrobium nobile]